jgi:hypothetical protein
VTQTEVTFRGLGEEGSTLMLSWSEDDISSVLLVPVPLSPFHDPALPPQLSEWETTLTLTPGAHLLVLALRDDAGNLSAPTTLSFTVLLPAPTPVPLSPGNLIMTEISFDPADPYIELYNPTNVPVILDGGLIELSPFDGTFILLEGTVSPRSFFLIAPEGRYPAYNALPRDIPMTAETDGVTVLASLTDSVDHLPHCPNWCARAGGGMVIERFAYALPTGDRFGNWGAPLPLLLSPGSSGTPGTRNTLNHLLTMDGTIEGHVTPDPDLYVVHNNTVRIAPASSLTLLAGTTLLFSGDDAALRGEGDFHTEGTESSRVTIGTWGTTTDPEFRPNNVDIILSGAPTLTGTDLFALEQGIWFQHASATLSDVTVSDAHGGILADWGTTSLDRVTVTRVDQNPLYFGGGTTTLTNVTVTDIDNNAIIAIGGTLDARDVTVSQASIEGVLLYGVDATIDGINITHAKGGAISLGGEGNATVTDAVLSNNWSHGAVVYGDSTLVMSSSTIQGSATALRISDGTFVGEDLLITRNMYGISAGEDTTVVIHDSVIAENREGVLPFTQEHAPALVDVSQNYWGHPDGPTLPDDTTEKGDTAPDTVVTTPFLVEPPAPQEGE